MYALLFILVGIIALFVLTFFNSIFEKIKAEKRAIKLAQEQVERKLAEGKAAQTLAEEQLARKLVDKDKEIKTAVEDAGQSKRELIRIREAYGTAQKNEEEVERLQKIIDGTMKDYPIIAEMIADFDYERSLKSSQAWFANKRAYKALEQVQKAERKSRYYAKEFYNVKWILNSLQMLYPWIEELQGIKISRLMMEYSDKPVTGDDAVKNWITKEEYETLPTVEKYQRALDNYFNREKTNLELGTDYERYIGYLYEEDGWDVTYYGIENGMKDHGCDLICKRNGKTHIIQCKCWSAAKKVHENMINQLYGTTVAYYLDNMHGDRNSFFRALEDKTILPLLCSTTAFSKDAEKFADVLGIILRVKPLKQYLMIKCNINQTTKEKIYHLPFDPQYNNCKVNKPGECYALTVQEAEDKGFRRAFHKKDSYS